MIERLYLDNIRSFVNFEWRPDRLTLLLGANGAGKTALLETLAAVQGFLTGERSVSEAFPTASRTRWEARAEQTVEVDVRVPAAGLYRYRLVVVHDLEDPGRPLVKQESLQLDDHIIIEFTTGDLSIYRNGEAVGIPGARPTRSGVGALDPARDPVLRTFQDWLRRIWLLRPDPRAMSARFDRRHAGTVPRLVPDLSNFAAYYSPTLAAEPGAMFKAMRALEPALPGLVELRANEGELEARFEREGVTSTYSFDELSDGERALVALYVVLHTMAVPGRVLLLDEPDNYLGLREIQPWLAELTDRALKSDGPQVILISHHPEALNFLAPERGVRMFRAASGPTRIERFKPQEDMLPDEMVARGWDDAR
jgi:ABC-type hemin transport system ATPase subunit